MKTYTLDELKRIFEVDKSFTTRNLCYESAYFRLINVVSKVGGIKLEPPGNWTSDFCRIWGIKINRKKDNSWLKFNLRYRATGAPGALEMRGWSHIIREEQIWKGELKPGAVLQGWRTPGDYLKARDGERPNENSGHTFIFLNYRYNEKNIITGIYIVDQTKVREYRKKSWAILFAANFPLFLGTDFNLTITK